MAKYTTELRSLTSQGFDFGMNRYPIFDEAYRAILNKKILDHYRYCEIGSETPARFKHYLNSTLEEIMPYYNQLYRSELLQFNPLYTVDYSEESKKTTAGESETESNRTAGGSSENTQTVNTENETLNTDNRFLVESDTPGGLISVGDIKTSTWASGAKQEDNSTQDITTNTGTVTDEGSSSATEAGTIGTTVNNVDDYIRTVKGNQGGKNYSELLNDFRSTFLNIDDMIIKDLKILFMGVY